MKANELRINNWYDHNGDYRQVTPNTIEEVWESERSWCRPIPLTEEWLLKFGFENSSHPDFDFHINIPHLRDNNYKSTIGVIEWSDGVIEVYRVNGKTDVHTAETCGVATIQYVHQLQNLYFALTGEELNLHK